MSLAQRTNGKSSEAGAAKNPPVVMRAIPVKPGTIEPAPPFPMPAIAAPVFANREVDIRAHGAVADPQLDVTAAIDKAIEACTKAGGGRVLIPAGEWLTGPIQLRSNIELHLAAGATVRFITNPRRYLPPVFVRWNGIECFNYSPLIYAHDCENVAITGRGVLMGQGHAWWPMEKQEQRCLGQLYSMVQQGVPVEQRQFGSSEFPLRPQFILAINCRNVLLEDFTIAEGGPQWSLHLAYCTNVTARRVRIVTPDGPNNDGIVIDSSADVLIEDCDLHTHDDCIALKSGLNEDGLRVNRPTENVIIRRIRATEGHGGITVGSDMSGGVRNVFVHDCYYDGPSSGIRMKAARGRGGVVENIFVQDITMGRIPGDAIQLTTEYATFVLPNGKPPTFRNIEIRNVKCENANTAVRMIGLADSAVKKVLLENVTIQSEDGLFCQSGNEIRLKNVNISPMRGPVLALKDSQDVVIDGLHNATGSSVFLDLRGRQTRNIRLEGESSHHTRPAIVLGVDVPRDAIVHE